MTCEVILRSGVESGPAVSGRTQSRIVTIFRRILEDRNNPACDPITEAQWHFDKVEKELEHTHGDLHVLLA